MRQTLIQMETYGFAQTASMMSKNPEFFEFMVRAKNLEIKA